MPVQSLAVALSSGPQQLFAAVQFAHVRNELPVKISNLQAAEAGTYFAPVDFTVLRDVDINFASGLKHSLRKLSLLSEVKPHVQRLLGHRLEGRLHRNRLGGRDQFGHNSACHGISDGTVRLQVQWVCARVSSAVTQSVDDRL